MNNGLKVKNFQISRYFVTTICFTPNPPDASVRAGLKGAFVQGSLSRTLNRGAVPKN